MEKILEPILQSHKLFEYVKILQEKAETEKQKRQRFYAEITPSMKAEFINGEVIVHSPVVKKHNVIGGLFLRFLSVFNSIKKLGFVGYEKILIKLTRNDFEPDICFFRNEVSKKFTDDQMFFPAPDFIVEILSKSTEKRDRGIKFRDYALHGVGEYWIIDPKKQIVEQYILNGDKYELIKKTDTGIIRSLEVKNFEIPVEAIFDEQKNLKALLTINK
jgi:Uma2 family endonuclease